MRFRFAVLISAAVAASVVVACSNQGEGQICDRRAGNNGNDDCQSGLVCTQNLGANGDRCCPQDRSTATTPECALASPGISDASSAPPDGNAPTVDAGSDATPQDAARADAAPDASADAPADAVATSDASDAGGQ